MKFTIQILLYFIILLTFSECKNAKITLENKHLFKIESATYTNWVGGVKGVKGTTIELLVANQEVIIDTLYFRGNKIIPELKKTANGKLQIVGSIINKEKQILVLHSNPEQEYGNKPPIKSNTNFPFELASDEIIISFIENKTKKYFKIKLTQEKSVFYQ